MCSSDLQLSQSQMMKRCLLIIESPEPPGHYRYLKLGPRLHPLYGNGGVQFCDLSDSCVYCGFEFLRFVFSTLERNGC